MGNHTGASHWGPFIGILGREGWQMERWLYSEFIWDYQTILQQLLPPRTTPPPVSRNRVGVVGCPAGDVSRSALTCRVFIHPEGLFSMLKWCILRSWTAYRHSLWKRQPSLCWRLTAGQTAMRGTLLCLSFLQLPQAFLECSPVFATDVCV